MPSSQQNLFDTEPPPWEVDAAALVRAATVVFPEPPHGEYDYIVPSRLVEEVEPGRRLRVPLGRGNRTVEGYCVAVETKPAPSRKLKDVRAVVDDAPLLSPPLLRLARWMADYYLCPLGQALESIVPSGVRRQAGTRETTLLSVPTRVAARLTQLKLPKKQAVVLRILASSPKPLTPPQLAQAADCTQAPISALRKRGLITSEVRRVVQDDEQEAAAATEPRHRLNKDQQAALDAVVDKINEGKHETFLLFGVTGSGKTEVYIRAIERVIEFGRQAIVLVPEISLTPQTRQRFRARFPNVAVLHSHLTPRERHWHWRRIARGEVQVVVGARSAAFAPTPHLGLIVIDEEHDASFKQDASPRYHARDVARFRAAGESVPLVLGSATPSLESWRAAKEGDSQLLTLPNRVLDRPLPYVAAIDLRNEAHQASSRGAISRQLHVAMNESLRDGGQVILLLNRRGYATSIQCPACGHAVVCADCNIALTHHRATEQAVCHYCEHTIRAPTVCPECNFAGIRFGGVGTQRLEDEVKSRFPDYASLRMDSDAMQKPGSHEAALAQFRAGEVQILLGTQMIAKGLDFPNVTLVGVINADTALHFADFRAAERTFQLVTQVAGRTGRGERGGRVLVQTFSPEHPALAAAFAHDFERFAGFELPQREEFGYPPCASMVRLVVSSADEKESERFADALASRLRERLGESADAPRLLGPAPASMAKLRGKFRFHVILLSAGLDRLREIVSSATEKLKAPDGVSFTIDVDPFDML